MKTLIINNNTKFLKELVDFFPGSDVLNKEDLNEDLVKGYEMIVMSGGSDIPTVYRHSEEYATEMDIVKNSNAIIVGICLGAEIIVKAFGGTLKELQNEQRGEVNIKIIDNELANKLDGNNLTVKEGHKIGIDNLPEDFIICATSEHGIEIFKHKEKPIFGFQFHPEISNLKNFLQQGV